MRKKEKIMYNHEYTITNNNNNNNNNEIRIV